MKNAATAKKAVDLGTKRHCPKCGAKFYDFNKPAITCPKCGKDVDPNAVTPLKIPKAAPVKAERPKPAAEDDEAPTGREDEIASESFEELDDISDTEEVVDVPKVEDDEDGSY